MRDTDTDIVQEQVKMKVKVKVEKVTLGEVGAPSTWIGVSLLRDRARWQGA